MEHEKTPCPSPTCPICSRLKPEPKKLTLKERIQRQRIENIKNSERIWESVKNRILSGEFILNEYDAYMIFRISAHALTIRTQKKEFTVHATSGKGKYLNNNSIESQSASYQGVTPVGKYRIKPQEFSDPNIIIDLKRNIIDGADWGDWRVRLHNKTDEGFNYYGRNNFFLHCGSKQGSAGCIDIGGSITGNTNTERVALVIKKSIKPILLEVRP